MNKFFSFIGLLAFSVLALTDAAFAEEVAGGGAIDMPSISAAFAMSCAVISGTVAQAKAASTALDAIGRNPSASGNLFVPMILGLVFLETLVIFTFVIAAKLAGVF